MYWPIGIPKCYATNKDPHIHDRNSIIASDGLENGDPIAQFSDGRAEEEEKHKDKEPGQDLTEGHDGNASSRNIIGITTSRAGHVFATITATSLTIWQTKPTVVLATVIRSEQSLKAYGRNVSLLMRPDALIIVLQTRLGFLITYSLASDPNALVYRTQLVNARRQSADGFGRSGNALGCGPGEGRGICEVNIRFRMVIRIDAGIAKALALDDALIVATNKPSAIQCIRWSPDRSAASHSTELLKRLPWFSERTTVIDMIYDRPMNLHVWIGSDGNVYAVQQARQGGDSESTEESLFQGYCFHQAQDEAGKGIKASVNARFSLIAVGCNDSSIHIYTAKDYLGNIPHLRTLRLPVSQLSSGRLTHLTHSPDGYCIFAGFENGWAMWSVYGKLGANSFNTQIMSPDRGLPWLGGVADAFWVGGGAELMLLGEQIDQLWLVEMARASVTGCFASGNVQRCLLQASSSVILYRGLGIPDMTAISGETSLWQTVQLPSTYLADQWPIKCAAISPDGRYVAAAGRRGLAHYGLGSGRWRMFDDPAQENAFTVRGGMCWYQHILVAAVEADRSHEIRLYSREKSLDSSSILHTEVLSHPAIHVSTSGSDSLLVYTHENILFHYIFLANRNAVKLALVGQIAFHGIIRAPARVRSISWLVPDEQREQGEPSQDVATAAVLFLVDGKLVLLQPSANESGELKYDMRVIAHSVEYYALTREQFSSTDGAINNSESETSDDLNGDHFGHSMRDSLWYFDGTSMQVWPDVLDVVASAPTDLGRELPDTVSIQTDFYPLSAMIYKGILTGLESDLVQRRDVDLAYFRFSSRTHLFIPALLRHHLANYDSSAALHLSDSYQRLPYFAHALEVLLHDVLDDEVEDAPSAGDRSLLAGVLSFLSSFSAYLDIIVGCTRKTELRSWRTLFNHLPPVQNLFEDSLDKGHLKTAGGYLLVLHTFDEESFNAQQIARLLRLAKQEGDWDLCKELARFLVGIDDSGNLLKTAMELAGLYPPQHGPNGAFEHNDVTSHGKTPGSQPTIQTVAATRGILTDPVLDGEVSGWKHSHGDCFSPSRSRG